MRCTPCRRGLAAALAALALTAASATPSPDEMRATQIIGMEAENRAGEALGEVEDLVIDRDSGRVAYAALARGGFLGVGGKRFAYPVRALEAGRERGTLVLEADGAPVRIGEAPLDDALVRASDLIARKTYSATGEDLGRLEDLVVGLREGRVRRALVDGHDGALVLPMKELDLS